MLSSATSPSDDTIFASMKSSYIPEARDPKDQEGVELLLGISNIVSNEIANSKNKLFNDYHDGEDDGKICDDDTSRIFDESSISRINDIFRWHRIRTVSIDQENGQVRGDPPRRIMNNKTEPSRQTKPSHRQPAIIVSPTGTRGLRTVRKPSLKLLASKSKTKHIRFPKLTHTQQSGRNLSTSITKYNNKAIEQRAIKGKPITVIQRKKFSWKNYPELEAFLVCNREEYLRHSALNYTIQQKQYNNRLTERLLDLAAEHLYVFDQDEFSFVTVRDRIRCFYKSYVQSSKKRGIVLGYAAKKAGILSPADLQRSARKEGMIITPVEL